MRSAMPAMLAVAAMVAVGCGGDDDDGGGEGGGSASGETLTVWNNEFQPDRMAATQAILDEFTQKTGIKTKQVGGAGGPARDADDQRRGGRRAARRRARHADWTQSQQYAPEEIFDSEAAQAVVDKLGPDTFSKKALDLVSRDGMATGVPSDGWGQLLIYRKDLFDKAGPRRAEVARRRAARPPRSSTATAWPASRSPPRPATASRPRRSSTSRSPRAASSSTTAARSPSTRPRASRRCAGTATSRRTTRSPAPRTSTPRAARTSPGSAAMMFWSPFLLDGMAGLRDDTKPTCHECKEDVGVPGQEQRPRRAARRLDRRAEPVRLGLDGQHHGRRADRGRAEARRVHAGRRLRALARALAAGQVPGPRSATARTRRSSRRHGPSSRAAWTARRR